MKLISWNVNGLRAVMNKGFNDFFESIDADIFCIQETKLQEGQIDYTGPDAAPVRQTTLGYTLVERGSL